MDYARYQTLAISRRGPGGAVLDIQMRATNGKLPTAGHDGHRELAEIWRDVGADDSVRCAVLRGEGQGFSGGGDLSLVEDMAADFEVRSRVWKEARDLVYNIVNCDKPIVSALHGPAVGAGLVAGLLADIPIAARSAKIVDGHTRLGVAAGDHAAIVWPRWPSTTTSCCPRPTSWPTGWPRAARAPSAGPSTRSTTGCAKPGRPSTPRSRWNSWASPVPTCAKAWPRCASAVRRSFRAPELPRRRSRAGRT